MLISTRASIHIVVPILLAFAMNTIIYMKGWGSRTDNKIRASRLLPPGYVIAIVWTVILGLLGYVHYTLYPSDAHWIIVGTVLYCLSYPILTSGLQADRAPLLNTLALILAGAVVGTVALTKPEVTVFTIPLFIWTSYVNIADRFS